MPPKRKSAIRHLPKVTILLDEGFSPRQHFKELNKYFNVRHIKHDFKLGGVPDETVYQLAKTEGRMLVTFNVRDFQPLLITTGPSIIGVSTNLTTAQIDLKLSSFLKRLSRAHQIGNFYIISGETRSNDAGQVNG